VKEKYQLQIRAEFQNVFNRVFYSPRPITVSPVLIWRQPTPTPFRLGSTAGELSGGYGFVNAFNGAGTSPRTGKLVARFTF